MDYISIKFELDGCPHYAKGPAPCTKKAYEKGEFSEGYIRKCAYCIIYGHMEIENLEGEPVLVDWKFQWIND